MTTFYKIAAILGLISFIWNMSLQKRIDLLEERRHRDIESEHPEAPRANLHAIIREYIGKTVTLDFYDDEEDLDTVYGNTKHVSVVISDCDDKWVLVTLTKGKDTVQKLLRIDSIKGIGTVETANE